MGTRYIKQVPNTYPGAGGKQPSNIALAGNLRELFLELTGQLTCTSGNNVSANMLLGDEWGAIQRVDLIANSSDVLASFTGDELWHYNRKWYNANPPIAPAFLNGAANPSFDSTLIFPLWSPLSVKPLDTALNTTNLTNLRADITWNSFTSINSAATGWAVNPVLTVTGYYDDSAFAPPLLKKIVKTTATPTAAQTDYRIDLPVTPQYRSMMINTVAGGVDDAACISNIQLVSGSTIFADLTECVLREGFRLRNGMPSNTLATNATPGVLYTQQLRQNVQNNENAWYHLELCPDGYLTEAVNTAGLPEFYLRMNVLKACTINISSTQLFPLSVPTS